jgi:hypothetical protein
VARQDLQDVGDFRRVQLEEAALGDVQFEVPLYESAGVDVEWVGHPPARFGETNSFQGDGL